MGVILEFGTQARWEDRVKANTAPEINRRIDLDLKRRIRFYAVQDPQTITERIEELDREWDIERILETKQPHDLRRLTAGLAKGRKWFILPLVVSGFLLNYAIQGWYPPVSILRRRGVRTRLEIEPERYALKILLGGI